jgi:hypothetical protein
MQRAALARLFVFSGLPRAVRADESLSGLLRGFLVALAEYSGRL